MVNQAIELLELNKDDNVLDLFCGLGNFTIPIAKYCANITGIEADERMVERGYENAKHNQATNINFYSANLEQDLSKHDWANQTYDKILLDPPRSGAEEIIKHFPNLSAKQIVYISCNPATLARDAGELVHAQGYELEKAGVMDMFPHTSHTESIALFRKK